MSAQGGVARTDPPVVLPRLAKARPVRAAPDVGIVELDRVVLPPAHGADLDRPIGRFGQGEVATARAREPLLPRTGEAKEEAELGHEEVFWREGALPSCASLPTSAVRDPTAAATRRPCIASARARAPARARARGQDSCTTASASPRLCLERNAHLFAEAQLVTAIETVDAITEARRKAAETCDEVAKVRVLRSCARTTKPCLSGAFW